VRIIAAKIVKKDANVARILCDAVAAWAGCAAKLSAPVTMIPDFASVGVKRLHAQVTSLGCSKLLQILLTHLNRLRLKLGKLKIPNKDEEASKELSHSVFGAI
jgi:hypothetical protein